MINVKDAIKTAYKAANDFYDNRDFTDILLEEVDMTDDEKYWLITVSINVPTPRTSISPIDDVLGQNLTKSYIRNYKIIKIEASTGEVKSMKIREV